MSAAYLRATVTLPGPIMRKVDRLARTEYRSRSEIVRRALIDYLEGKSKAQARRMEDFARQAAALPEAEGEPDEISAFERSRGEFARGEVVTLDELNGKFGYVARRVRPKRRSAA